MPTIQVLDEAVVPELPVARGTVKKGMMAGMAAMILGMFLAFTREYVASARVRKGEPARPLVAEGASAMGQHTLQRGEGGRTDRSPSPESLAEAGSQKG